MYGIKHIVDELGDIRAQIATWKRRETALRAQLIAYRPNGPIQGTRFTARVAERPKFTFDKTTLPEEILRDPAYQRLTFDIRKLPAEIRIVDRYFSAVFDPGLLGNDIRTDSRYTTVKFTTYVTVKAHATSPQNMK